MMEEITISSLNEKSDLMTILDFGTKQMYPDEDCNSAWEKVIHTEEFPQQVTFTEQEYKKVLESLDLYTDMHGETEEVETANKILPR